MVDSLEDGGRKNVDMGVGFDPVECLKRVQDALEQSWCADAKSQLAHIARVVSLGALTASIVHEVSQPLSAISLNASTCLRMLAADPPDVEGARETARLTVRDGKRASDVVTGLRVLFSGGEPVTGQVDLNQATRDVLALVSSELRQNLVVLQLELLDRLRPVNADRVQIQQVILNLIVNALDAMRGVEGRQRRLVIRTDHEEGEVRFSVQDAGTGISPQVVHRLFEPFYTTKLKGMGVGLAVSRSIVRDHGGRLWAASNDGPGATFSFCLPARSPDPIARTERQPSSDRKSERENPPITLA
jgi:C4-dicarboxylate-specific signal transduction histidine kinase